MTAILLTSIVLLSLSINNLLLKFKNDIFRSFTKKVDSQRRPKRRLKPSLKFPYKILSLKFNEPCWISKTRPLKKKIIKHTTWLKLDFSWSINSRKMSNLQFPICGVLIFSKNVQNESNNACKKIKNHGTSKMNLVPLEQT